MDNSGKNRYELLFMDDDVSDPLDNIIKKKVKQPAAAAATGSAAIPATAVTTSNKGQTNNTNKQQNASSANDSLKKNSSEKENKSFAMNKNVDFNNRKSNTASGNNAAASGGGGGGGGSGGLSKAKSNQQQLSSNNQNSNRSNRDNFNGPASQNRNSTSKPQNGESREQRNNRRNRENGIPGSMGGGAGGIGEYNNDSLQQNQQQQRIRQNNQRFNGPPRNRSGAEGGSNVRGGKREFDRQSGSDKTGVKAVDKRDGAGAHNWGSVKQDIEDINKSNDEAGLTDKEESGNDQTAAEQNASIEEETKELTLDEWKAQRQQRAKPQFNIRKAGEGEDVTQWKKMIALNNKKKEGDSEEELEYDPSMYPQRVGRLQRVLDIQFHFNDGRRGGGGMGRGRGRGARPTGGAERPVGGSGGGGGGGGGSGGSAGVGGGNAGGAGGVGAAVAPVGGGRPEGPRVNVGRPRNENPRREGGGMEKQQRGGQHAPKVDDERQFPTLS